MADRSSYPSVYVEWVDSAAYEGWSDVADLEDLVISGAVATCRSHGYLVGASAAEVLVASSINSDGHALGVVAIPRVAIVKMIGLPDPAARRGRRLVS